MIAAAVCMHVVAAGALMRPNTRKNKKKKIKQKEKTPNVEKTHDENDISDKPVALATTKKDQTNKNENASQLANGTSVGAKLVVQNSGLNDENKFRYRR